MNRRGNEAIWLLVGVIAGLLVLALVMWILIPAFKTAKVTLSCGIAGNKGTCKATCGEGEYRAWDGLFCADDTVCCKSKTSESITTTTGTTTPKEATVALQPAEITVKRATATKALAEGQTEALMPDTSYDYIITVKTYSHTNDKVLTDPAKDKCLPHPVKDKDGNEILDLSGRKICAGQWNKTMVAESQNNDFLWGTTTIQGVKGWNGLTDENGRAADQNAIIFDQSKITFSTVKKDGVFVTTSTYRIKTNFGNDYNNQRVKLTISAFPGLELGDYRSLEKQYTLYFKVFNGITVTGLTNTWSTEKQVTVQCDPQIMTCSNIYFYFMKDDVDPITGKNYREAKTPVQCAPGDVLAGKFISTPPAFVPTSSTSYCLTSGQDEACTLENTFPTQGDCERRRSEQLSTPDFSAITSFQNSLMSRQIVANNLMNEQIYGAFLQQTNKDAVRQCIPLKQIPVETPPAQLYKADFDTKIQKTAIKLDQGFMSNTTICMYAEVANKVGADGKPLLVLIDKPRRVFIDTVPPHVEIKFNPWKLTLHFICIDELSGCKDTVGLAFINDVKKFLPALFKNPQSAATWCPASTTYGSAYEARQAKDASYTINEVRVLCMRGEDNAGNTALTMTTVFPTYDLLATVVQEAMK
jgi:hypothetical protein